MAEHARTENPHTGKLTQWVDAELCIVMDRHVGEPERFANGIFGTLEQALEYVKARPGWEGRTVIVRLQTVVGYKVD